MTGLDISPTALITAERRATDAGVDVKFAVADSTKLEGYADAFDTVIDSGMFHCLDDDGKRQLRRRGAPGHPAGATLLLSCFSDAEQAEDDRLTLPGRPAVSEQTLRDVLGGAGWDIASWSLPGGAARSTAMTLEMAFWYVRAQRRN